MKQQQITIKKKNNVPKSALQSKKNKIMKEEGQNFK